MDDIMGMISLILAVVIMLSVPIGMFVAYLRGNTQAIVVLGFALLTVLLGVIGLAIAVIVLIMTAIRGNWQIGGMAIAGVVLGVILTFVVGLLGLSGMMFLDPTAFRDITTSVIL